MLDYYSDLCRAKRLYRRTVHKDLSAVRPHEPGYALKQNRLSASVPADHPVDLSGLEFNAHVVQSGHLAKTLRDVLNTDNSRHLSHSSLPASRSRLQKTITVTTEKMIIPVASTVRQYQIGGFPSIKAYLPIKNRSMKSNGLRNDANLPQLKNAT